MTATPETAIPKLDIFNEASFTQKLQRFGAAGINSVHFVLDFDYTLTMPFMADGNRAPSSWGILERHLPLLAQKQCQDMYEYYVVKEIDGTLTAEEAETWWTTALTIQRDSQIDLSAVEAKFMEQATIRPGTHELFEEFDASDIPSLVLSAGVKNVIDIWCAAYGISPSLVVSTELITDDDGKMIGWDETTMVHALNKDETDHPEMNRYKSERPYTVVIGDNLHDSKMAAGDENVIRIRIVDLKPGDDSDAISQTTAEQFDAMLTTSDLFPIVALIKQLKL